ncbi:mtor [Cordylochernes scorpioides]|uniref:non-specific serine/threonine protein kinase n=1 Tax=Cordylochernes scorpioides TaxID=51811 RepID=A0ABY6K9B4_9ARAC|nr:mtor [Cordylochernes scorpioides]
MAEPVGRSVPSINNKLQQPEAAAGVLEYAMKNHTDMKIKERWYEILHDWENALRAYQQAREKSPENSELILGQMRCLEVLGEWQPIQSIVVLWRHFSGIAGSLPLLGISRDNLSINQCREEGVRRDELYMVASSTWAQSGGKQRRQMAPLAAAAAWGLGQWEAMGQYAAEISRDSTEGSFYRAVLSIHNTDFSQAQLLIDKARDLLDTDLTAMAGESYSRAYGALVQVQMLAELEEVIQYKLVSERREAIRQKWWDRLQGCERNVEDWQKILQVHSLVLRPQDDMRTWIKFANLCQNAERLALSARTLQMLLGQDNLELDNSEISPQLMLAVIKHTWKSGEKESAFQKLHEYVENVPFSMVMTEEPAQFNKDLAKCYLKLGEWQENLEGVNENSIPNILKYYAAAKDKDRNWYKACHAWAYMNYEAVLFYKHKAGDDKQAVEQEHIKNYALPAVKGLFRSISLSQGNSLQDTLRHVTSALCRRLLTLWFDHGHHPDIHEATLEGIETVPIETWLQVIPQLIARIDMPNRASTIHQLLMDIAKKHPQALIYPLTVASKSAVPTRQHAANRVLASMAEHSGELVKQALTVSEELIRVAILWHELWHEGLEEASRLYFGERNVQGMFATLEPLHIMMERGPQTLKEVSFNQAYGRDLLDALEHCQRYQCTGNIQDLTQAWDLYYHVFRRISKQLPQLTSLELQYVSPNLLNCRDLELAVPGSYVPGQPIVRIARVESSLQVISSKQRPRKLSIRGSNGKDFMFLLKGHEDLRQDERVMQLFGLVNSLLINDPATARRNLTIQRYAVIPLSTNSGLIGWVPHCDTLHTLIRDYREKKRILINIEHRIMLRVCDWSCGCVTGALCVTGAMAPDYDHLTLMQKVEVFEHALETTNGDDLAKLLWLKSPNSEVWFDRRNNYTRSLAVMSMVGYVLGLGDRHPSNLMLDRLSGKILHIDFGDCFEVAMTREKFPEKIPFRLTRMLINAMEVTGIEGTYRTTCETVMKVLRKNKDSLMAVLEAFVYDPLLNWRLVDAAGQQKGKLSKPRADSSTASSSQEQGDIVESESSKREPTAPGTVAQGAVPFVGLNLDVGADESGCATQPEALNKKAIAIISRVRDKLTGRDFCPDKTLEVREQVELLIKQATSHENLCQCYIGWSVSLLVKMAETH